MAHDPNSDLSRALAALSIAQLWRAAGLRGEPPKRDGLVQSPFRDDRHASFSVFAQGRAFKDQASGEKGGLWQFAKLAWPNLPSRELAQTLIALSGVPLNERTPGRVLSAEERRKAQAAALYAAERQIEREHERALSTKITAAALPEWPDFVRDRWIEGEACALEVPSRLQKLARDRGWPLEWVEQLVVAGKLATPWLPWSGPDAAAPKRGRACLVEMPVLADAECAVGSLRPVGYHQRFWIDGRKQWVYVPSRPKNPERCREGFSAQLLAWAQTQPEDRSLVPALPFVLGSLEPRWVCILEGQWDAITLAGAVGFFEDSWCSSGNGVTFFGVRGASGIDVLLAYWGPWFRRWAPRVWVLADADKAGRAWIERERAAVPGAPALPTVAEKLRAAGASSVKVSVLRAAAAAEHGKDFNDWWRSVKPTREQMERWLRREGVLCG